ncbi:MAG: DNA polymerase III subunit delta [Chloroflexota bacterium]
MLYILSGDDDYSVQGKLSQIEVSLNEPEMLSHNTSVLDGRHLTLRQLTNTCDVLPFLAQKRLVVVEGLLSRFEPPSGRGARRQFPRPEMTKELAEWTGLADYVDVMPESTILVLRDGKLGRSNRLLTALSRKAKLCQFPMLRGPALHSWIQARVAKSGGTIAPTAVRLLADLVGGNLWLESGEIDKLLAYSSGRTIGEQDIHLLASHAAEPNIFAMVDAVIAKRSSVAVALLHRLVDQGSTPPYILTMITRQFRLLAQAASLASDGLRQAEIGSHLGISSDYALRKTLDQAKRYSLASIAAIYQRLLEADISIKTGRWEGEMALDLLIVNLCSKREH